MSIVPSTYDIVDPKTLYRGKSYSSLAEDWLNWYVSADPDKRTLGPVVFLRSTPIHPIKPDGNKELTELNVTNIYAEDPLYDRPYPNNPHVRVGGDKLQIRKDQAVFIPIINAFEIARKPFQDWGSMHESTSLTIDYGDNPPEPEQLLIDEEPIKTKLDDFRIATNLFPVIIPEADYGRSLKDFLEESIAPGQYLAILEGYFVLIRNLSVGLHRIYSRASAPRERGGPYVAELLYEINVENKRAPRSRGAVGFSPPRNRALIDRTLREKEDKGEISGRQATNIIKAMAVTTKKTMPPKKRAPRIVKPKPQE
jgi:hypothetical protein